MDPIQQRNMMIAALRGNPQTAGDVLPGPWPGSAATQSMGAGGLLGMRGLGVRPPSNASLAVIPDVVGGPAWQNIINQHTGLKGR